MSPDQPEPGKLHAGSNTGEARSGGFRVLQIVNSPEPGGVLSLSRSIRDGLTQRGCQVETAFITPSVDADVWAKTRGCLAVARRIAFGRFDAVIAYQGAGAITVALSRFGLSPRARIVHQTTQPAGTSASVRFFDRLLGSLGLYQANVVNTASTQAQFDEYPSSYREKLVLIEHGVAPPVITSSREQVLRRYNLPTSAPILLNTARLVADKNQAVLIKALARVPDAHLVIAGGGEMREDYALLAQECGVAGRVHMLGALPYGEAIELYPAADLFVFPTLHETFGIAPVEAVMLGVPALVSDIAVLREVLSSDGATEVGFIPPHDPEAWATAINNRLRSPASTVALSRFAERIRWKYSEDRMIREYLTLLARLSPGARIYFQQENDRDESNTREELAGSSS